MASRVAPEKCSRNVKEARSNAAVDAVAFYEHCGYARFLDTCIGRKCSHRQKTTLRSAVAQLRSTIDMSDITFDDLIGKVILVGVTYLDKEDNLLDRKQWWE